MKNGKYLIGAAVSGWLAALVLAGLYPYKGNRVQQKVIVTAPKNVVIGLNDVVKINGFKAGRVNGIRIERTNIVLELGMEEYLDSASIREVEIRDWGDIGATIDIFGKVDSAKTNRSFSILVDSTSYEKRSD